MEEVTTRDKQLNQGRGHTRNLVRIRDNHTCQDCKRVRKGGERQFDVHHLNGLCGKKSRGYDRIQDMGGLITLCHRCHFNRPEHSAKRKDYDLDERDGEILSMFLWGKTHKEISEKFHISRQRVGVILRKKLSTPSTRK